MSSALTEVTKEHRERARALLQPNRVYASLFGLQTIAQAIADAEKRGYERGRRDFQFAPEGDNHHNAALCPYCSPKEVAR